MDAQNIIKTILLIGIIYLIISSLTNVSEKFELTGFNSNLPLKLNMYDSNFVKYIFISFNQLKPEIRNLISTTLLNNKPFMDARENQDNVKNNIYYKSPLYIIKEGEYDKYADSKNNLLTYLVSDSGNYILTPEINKIKQSNKHIYNDPELNMMYYTVDARSKYIIRVNTSEFVEPKYLNLNSIGDFNFYILKDSGDDSLKVTLKFE